MIEEHFIKLPNKLEHLPVVHDEIQHHFSFREQNEIDLTVV